ncbi:hypothetical protein OAF54_01655 [bacterium]|nr:hypothetical protein [bacterium]
MSKRWNKNLEFTKDPSDVIDFTLNYAPLLQADTIASIVVTSENVTVDSSSVSGNDVTIWVSGGSAGSTGKITVKVTTSNATARVFERSFAVKVEEK